MNDQLREAGVVVGHLSRALLDSSRDLRTVPSLVKRIIRDEMWRQWADPASGRQFGPFRTFEHFVIAKANNGGLGSSIKQLRALCEGDPEARDAIDNAMRRDGGRPIKTVDNIHGSSRPSGTSVSAALRRLRKDAPELHADVLANRLSAHAAMVEAGYRPRTITIPVGRPDTVARSLIKHMSADDISRLAVLLSAYRGDRTT